VAKERKLDVRNLRRSVAETWEGACKAKTVYGACKPALSTCAPTPFLSLQDSKVTTRTCSTDMSFYRTHSAESGIDYQRLG